MYYILYLDDNIKIMTQWFLSISCQIDFEHLYEVNILNDKQKWIVQNHDLDYVR